MNVNDIRRTLTEVRSTMPLVHDGEAGARRLIASNGAPEPRRRFRLRSRNGVVIGLVVALSGAGAASAAAISASNGISHFFSDVPNMAHQKESGGQATRTPTVSLPAVPHTLVASVALPGGGTAQVYVTTETVDNHGGRCILVAQTLADGSDGGSEGVCGAGPDNTTATLVGLYAAMVGSVPDPAVSRVEVALAGQTSSAAVVARYFAISAPAGQLPSSVAGQGWITGFYADGQTAGRWPFTLTPSTDPCQTNPSGPSCHNSPGS